MTPQSHTVLVVEDDARFRKLIVTALEGAGFSTAEAQTAADAVERLKGFAYDALVVDLGLPDGSGMDVLESAIDRYPDIRAVVMTGSGSVANAVAAMKGGAVDFLMKPFPFPQLTRVLSSGLEQRRLREENAVLKEQLRDNFKLHRIIGEHSSMQELFSALEVVAPMNSTVLIHGETGTGKELVARTIHHSSPRSAQRFVAFNAAAIPEPLAEAELFGHSKGAFTGAVAARVGRFELAHRGTLFIDEVASMSLPLQAKLLRALQEREIERLGEGRPTKVDIRVIAATNTDLMKLVKEGTFREDLYYRLHVLPVTIPALRQRLEDIPLLAQHFVDKTCREHGRPKKRMSQDAVRALMTYDWPGNVRQFENAMEHAVAMSREAEEIGVEALPIHVRQSATSNLVTEVATSIPDEGIDFTSIVTQVERDLILRCLAKTRGNKRHAARLLQLSRTTFMDKLERLNLHVPEPRGSSASAA